jgi:hypothetical protein
MTISRITITTLAMMGSLMVSVPALANDSDRQNMREAVEAQYSGTESTMVPSQPSSSYDEPMLSINHERDSHWK